MMIGWRDEGGGPMGAVLMSHGSGVNTISYSGALIDPSSGDVQDRTGQTTTCGASLMDTVSAI